MSIDDFNRINGKRAGGPCNSATVHAERVASVMLQGSTLGTGGGPLLLYCGKRTGLRLWPIRLWLRVGLFRVLLLLLLLLLAKNRGWMLVLRLSLSAVCGLSVILGIRIGWLALVGLLLLLLLLGWGGSGVAWGERRSGWWITVRRAVRVEGKRYVVSLIAIELLRWQCNDLLTVTVRQLQGDLPSGAAAVGGVREDFRQEEATHPRRAGFVRAKSELRYRVMVHHRYCQGHAAMER
uniref:Uncharacterized protein n=1 Tax=Anopheles atroparvus TaxID=41427 RepID=A0A182IUN2_ANOAO